jgi:hypothetical protein
LGGSARGLAFFRSCHIAETARRLKMGARSAKETQVKRSMWMGAFLGAVAAVLAGGCDEHGGKGGNCPPGAAPDLAVSSGGAGDMAMTTPPAPDMAAAQCVPARPGNRFTIAVIPDTQYLFDGDRGNPDVLRASVQWIIDHTCDYNIVFTAGLGDIVQNADPSEFAAVDQVYRAFDQTGIQYSLPAGNHDLTNSGQYDNQRDPNAPYLAHFSSARVQGEMTFGGATANGYNSYFIFSGGGRKWLLFALDWRMSADSMAWVQNVLDAHATLPAIFTMHELVYNTGDPAQPLSANAALSDYGQTVWNTLIQKNDQVFLAINGHFWTPARTTLQNAAGHDVHLHLANYQDRYFGGSGMIRLYEFDLDHDTIEVSTHSPYMAAIPAAQRNRAQAAEVELQDGANHFFENIDFARRFAGFDGTVVPPPPPPVPVAKELIPGTVAYWRFEYPQGPVTANIPDLSGNGNDLVRITSAGGAATDLIFTNAYHPAQPSRGSLYFNGSKSTPPSYLQTVPNAMINTQTFPNGYTLEAFFQLPSDCCAGHAWMGAVGRSDSGGDAGKSGDDPNEPVATFSVTDGPGLQWAVFPTNYDGIKTSWSHILPTATWHHVAIVDDGHHQVMFVDGAEELQNPRSESIGPATSGKPWFVGAYAYAHTIDQAFYGWIGEVRIVDHAISADQYLTAR